MVDTTLVTASALERRTGAPAGWLIDEAAAGRLPHVRAGSRYLFHPELVERELLRRAGGEAPHPCPAREDARHGIPE